MSVPAGWYDDGSGRRRWWDGGQWTDHFAPETPDLPEEGGTVLAGEQTAVDAEPDAQASATAYTPPVDPNGYPQSGYGENPYGQNPYGQAPYGQASYPGAPAHDSQNPYAAPTPYGADAAYGAYGAPDPGPRKTPVLGYIGLGLAVIGGIIACIPNFVTFGIGSFLLFAAFVVSIIALFIKNTAKWPGIVGLILSVVMGIVATIVLSVTLFATYAGSAWDSAFDPYSSDEPWVDESLDPSDPGARPAAEEVAVGLEEIMFQQQEMEYPEGMLICLSEELVASDMSDASLQQIADGDPALTDPDDAMEFGSTLTDAASACATQ